MLVNVTPHAIVIRLPDGDVLLPPSGKIARVASRAQLVGHVDGVPVNRTVYGPGIDGLPDPVPGVTYVASMLVAQAAAAAGRGDVVAPDSGPTAIRGPDGQIVAVRGFVAF